MMNDNDDVQHDLGEYDGSTSFDLKQMSPDEKKNIYNHFGLEQSQLSTSIPNNDFEEFLYVDLYGNEMKEMVTKRNFVEILEKYGDKKVLHYYKIEKLLVMGSYEICLL